jgi:RNA methyltransferase, TrmH family
MRLLGYICKVNILAMLISSRNNPAIKSIRALRERKERDRTGLCFLEGIRIVGEAAQLDTEIQSLIVAPDLLKSDFANELVQTQRTRNVSIIEVTSDVFESLSEKQGPQGIAAVVKQRWQSLSTFDSASEPLRHSSLVIALDSPQDPGNIGTILRTSDAVGAMGVILLGQAADPYDPSALRASMGAAFSQQLAKASYAEFIAWQKASGFKVVGTSDKAEMDYRECAYTSPILLLMGSERSGLAPELQTVCDAMVRIPMLGRSDSLNLAVATGVMLYAIRSALGAQPSARH